MAQRSRRGVEGHHHGGGEFSRGKTLGFFSFFFQADSSPWGAAGVEAGPAEGMEPGRVAAHPPAQTPSQLGFFLKDAQWDAAAFSGVAE